ncbi:MAG: hypothetical protein FWE95_10785 [Planctomycetaceae bacterium]|nr:hypothetical protein [Planctomycetaceae bacterium]
MNSVVEKLAALEQEVSVLQPKMAPLTERIAALDQKVTGFARQLTDLAAESAAVKQDIELTRQGLARIQTLISESKAESEQLVAEQEEHQQRYKAMTAFVEAARQVFFGTDQPMGLTDQAKAVFHALPPTETADSRRQTADDRREPATVSPDMDAESGAETMPDEPPVEEPAADESVLSESDFDSVMPGAIEEEPEPWAIPPCLPDVSTSPEIDDTDTDAEPSDAEPSCEMASQLDVPPLNLAVPALPEQNEPEAINEQDEQEIEAMLADMMAPVTVGS